MNNENHQPTAVLTEAKAQSRPADDALWDQTIQERDNYHEWADKLAGAIAKHFNVDIGEHSNMNCPWQQALDAIEDATASRPEGCGDWISSVLQEVAELPDRTSPTDAPSMMLVSADELRAIIEHHQPSPRLVMTAPQLREALNLIEQESGDDDDELVFGIRQHKDDHGNVETGLCCWSDDDDGGVYPLTGHGAYAATADGEHFSAKHGADESRRAVDHNASGVTPPFDEWCIVETMYQNLFGRLTGQIISDPFLRLDIPSVNGRPAKIKLLNNRSIHSIDIVTKKAVLDKLCPPSEECPF